MYWRKFFFAIQQKIVVEKNVKDSTLMREKERKIRRKVAYLKKVRRTGYPHTTHDGIFARKSFFLLSPPYSPSCAYEGKGAGVKGGNAYNERYTSIFSYIFFSPTPPQKNARRQLARANMGGLQYKQELLLLHIVSEKETIDLSNI